MDTSDIIPKLSDLFAQWSGTTADDIIPLPLSGSDRRYFRLSNKTLTAIAVYNTNTPENRAFIQFTAAFRSIGMTVPTIYATDFDGDIYLLEDLGDMTLLQLLENARKSVSETESDFPPELWDYYREALEKLARLQIEGTKVIDYNYCYPTAIFGEQSMLWDCYQFKYWYLQPTHRLFDETALEHDFQQLSKYLAGAPSDYFMFRDFQARNIMLHRDELYFIDYQGGRKGPLQYDVASLLFQAKARIPNEVRAVLLNHYIQVVKSLTDLDEPTFRNYYYGFVLMRCMQVLGAYGFKGYYQRKAHFLSSIPYALDNLRWLLTSVQLPIEIPHLWRVLTDITQENNQQNTLQPIIESPKPTLNLYIQSFSYHKGLPPDDSGHGIGFVFDCRLIHNPGRYAAYKALSGLDSAVKAFFEKEEEMFEFLALVFKIVDKAVAKYLQRGFTDLGINFGCTGGQHRSVYAAEATASHLQACFGNKITIKIQHREQNSWALQK